MGKPAYKRVVLKLSGEALAGEKGFGIDGGVMVNIAKELKGLLVSGVQIAIVVGGGNIWRGAAAEKSGWIGQQPITWDARHIDQCPGATGCPERNGVDTRVQSALRCGRLRSSISAAVLTSPAKGRVVIFAEGPQPLFFYTPPPRSGGGNRS